jgi:two-component system, cell cycle response regulator DivK
MSGELILVVEDNDKNRKLVRDLLQFSGYQTLEAETAAQGLALAVVHAPRLILLDVQLPDMDGLAALRQLKADPRTAGIRVVALTAFAMPEDRARFLKAGFDGYLPKPIDARAFPGQVGALMGATPDQAPDTQGSPR